MAPSRGHEDGGSRGHDDRRDDRSRRDDDRDRGYDDRDRRRDRDDRGRYDDRDRRRGERDRSRSQSRRGGRSRSRRRGESSAIVSAEIPPADDADRRKKSKWDDKEALVPAAGAQVEALPAWMLDAPPMPPSQQMFTNRQLPTKKVIRMKSIQIRILLGKGGETMREITQRTGADIKIDNCKDDPEGNVSIVGDIERTEAVIREVLASKGCPIPEALLVGPDGVEVKSGDPADEELYVPVELVGLFIGKGGENIREMREKAGGTVFIGVQPAEAGSGIQKILIAGDHRAKATELVKEKILEVHNYVSRLSDKERNKKGFKGKGKSKTYELPSWAPANFGNAGAAQAAINNAGGMQDMGNAGGGNPDGMQFASDGQDTSHFTLGDDVITEMCNEIMGWGVLLVGDTSGWDGNPC